MKIQYLGTGAAEGIPAVFCSCENCRIAREKGGKNIRTRSQSLIDDTLMIDFPADTYCHTLRENIDLTYIHHYLITHTHADHLYPKELHNYAKGFGNFPEGHPPFHFWGGREMVELLRPYAELPKMMGRVVLHELKPFEPTLVGEHVVTALPAQHGTQTPYIYIIEKNGKAILYANDTGAIKDEVWDYFFRMKVHFDLVSMDCTKGNQLVTKENAGHMGFVNILEACARMEQKGYIDFFTRRIVNHFSHNNPQVNYEDRQAYEKYDHYTMAYDGMVVEF